MTLNRLTLYFFAALALCFFSVSLSQAQATRTWVSGVGDDVNPCSRTAPCKTFAGAISKTAAGGEINCLDPAGFGAVTITKSITIDCHATLGGILASLVSGVIINAGATDRIVLRGLDINGIGNGLDGIKLIAGGSLHVEDSVIYGMQNGMNVGAGNEIYIKNTYIRNNTNVGIFIAGPAGLVNAVIEKTTVENQAYGLIARNNTRVNTRGSVYSGNSNTGILAEPLGGGTAEVNVDSCIVTNNGLGMHSGAQGTLRVANSFISGNGIGVAAGLGTAATFFDNKLQGNSADGGFNLGLTTN